MTVAELIERLQEFDPTLPVCLSELLPCGHEDCWVSCGISESRPIESVSLVKVYFDGFYIQEGYLRHGENAVEID